MFLYEVLNRDTDARKWHSWEDLIYPLSCPGVVVVILITMWVV